MHTQMQNLTLVLALADEIGPITAASLHGPISSANSLEGCYDTVASLYSLKRCLSLVRGLVFHCVLSVWGSNEKKRSENDLSTEFVTFAKMAAAGDRPGLFDVFRADNEEEDAVREEQIGANEQETSGSDSDFDVGGESDSESSQTSEESSGSEGGGQDHVVDRDVNNAGPANPVVDGWNVVEPPEIEHRDIPEFRVRNTGPRNAPHNAEPIDYFGLFFDEAMFVHLVRQTNEYARWFLATPEVVEWLEQHPNSRFRYWPHNGITVVDMKKCIGLSLNMGLLRKKELASYWSSKPSQQTPFFNATMPQRLFLLMTRMFHVNDVHQPARGEEGFDPWHKVRPVLDHMNRACKQYYVPSREISIDESMIGMKNRCCYIQYMPNKRHARFGIKKFQLCDVCHVELYGGKDFDVRHEEGQAHAVVMRLMQACTLLNRGYHLYTDNFYTKPMLADTLFQQGTLLTGTVRSNSRGLSVHMKQARPGIGGTLYERQGQKLCVAFREKRSQRNPVLLLSTYHSARNEEREVRGRRKTKPVMVFDYNSHMGGVDLSDKKVCHIAGERPTHRYWIKIFRNLLDIAVLNAYEIYAMNTDRNRMCKHDFVVCIVESLCGARDQQIQPDPVRPLAPLHRLVLLPGRRERDCVVCSDRHGRGGNRRRSRHWCPGCEVGCHERCEPQLEHFRRVARRGRRPHHPPRLGDGGDAN
eukprot:TRINITY_DN58298_c0_g2_i4.p1 TRINITY_DN58298_c0_g2~~TRINITY_DN58298_c0_g2_i4.p1  ORF type:complete len:699 (+),score=112.90 TRINITY_DN58298_c0_g2_i4:68-2164(+)